MQWFIQNDCFIGRFFECAVNGGSDVCSVCIKLY